MDRCGQSSFNLPMPSARKVLLVSYWYPPAVGAAAERVQSFAKYLPGSGWSVEVLTTWHLRGAANEASVHRVLDPAAGERFAFADYDPRERPSRIKRFLRGFLFPDRFRLWAKSAAKQGQDIARESRADAIVTSFPPASCVLAGLRIHEATGIPLLIDFRDLWMGPGGYEPRRPGMKARHEELERRAVAAACGLVAVSEAMADHLARRHHFPRHRIAVIPNGYDPEPALTPRQGSADLQPLVVVHVGTVIARNRPDLFFEAVKRLRAKGGLAVTRFRFVGNLSREYLREAGLDEIVETTGIVPRESARQEMESATALLLLVGEYVGQWGNNAKLFEYVQTGRPILCLEETPGSGDGRLLHQYAAERTFLGQLGDDASIEGALTALHAYLQTSPQSSLHLHADFAEFSRPRLAARLAAHLELCLASKK